MMREGKHNNSKLDPCELHISELKEIQQSRHQVGVKSNSDCYANDDGVVSKAEYFTDERFSRKI